MATITKTRKNGKPAWRIEYKDAEGRHQAFRKTKEQADDFAAQLALAGTERQRSGPTAVSLAVTVAEYLPRFLAKLEARDASARYLHTTRFAFERHLLPVWGPKRLRDLDGIAFADWLGPYLKQRKLSRATGRILLASMRRLLSAARFDRIVSGNPLFRVGGELKLSDTLNKHVKAMDEAQRAAFLTAAYAEAPRFAPIWHLQLFTGMRPGEAYAMPPDNIYLNHDRGPQCLVSQILAEDGTLIGGRTKTGEVRHVDIADTDPSDTRAAVEPFKQHLAWLKREQLKRGWAECKSLFPSKTGEFPDPSITRRAFRRVLVAAGLPLWFTPHCLRHTAASLWLSRGLPIQWVQQQLGHKSIQMTVDLYGKWLRSERPTAAVRPSGAKSEAR